MAQSPAARRARSKSQSPCERGWCSQPFELPFGPETRRRVEHFLCPTFDTFYEVLTHASKPPSFRTYSSAEKYPALALEKLRDDFAVNVGQTPVDAVMTEGQLRVVDAQEVQHRRMDIIAVSRVDRRFVGPLVARAVGNAAFGAAAREPGGV